MLTAIVTTTAVFIALVAIVILLIAIFGPVDDVTPQRTADPHPDAHGDVPNIWPII